MRFPGSTMAGRRKGRIIAFQALYAWDVSHRPVEELLDFDWVEPSRLDKLGEEGLVFPRLIISGTIENIEEIDTQIKANLANWDFNRLNRVDLAIIRISVYSLLFQKDMHPSIVIDEAVDICKEFGSDESYRFVNAILDSIRKKSAGAVLS